FRGKKSEQRLNFRLASALLARGYVTETFPRHDTGVMELMSDSDVLRQLLAVARYTANVESQRLKMDFARYSSEEIAKPRYADHNRLLQHGFKIYAQNDEDGIVQEIFRRIGTASRTFIEFGVQNGLECNTAKLLVEGWRGLWLEANS